MKKLLCYIFFLLPSLAFCQNRNSIWCFGDSSGIDFSNLSNPTPFQTSMDGRGSCVSISDTNGQLLIYAQTFYKDLWLQGYDKLTAVFNKNHLLMDRGDSLIGDGWYRELVIIPNPLDTNLYYLFHTAVSIYPGLYYSVIDLSQNGGLGKVVQRNIQLSPFQMQDGLQAIKHGNGRDWWLLCHRWDINTNEIIKYLVTPSGISGPFIQAIGDTATGSFLSFNFSKSGNKVAIVDFHGLLELFNFDRCTGNFSLDPLYNYPFTSPDYFDFWSCEISPDENFLYVSQPKQYASYLFQLNLQDSFPWNTRDTLWTQTAIQYCGGALELAPDDKIYFSTYWQDNINFFFPYPDSAFYPENMNLSVINSPNNLGAACDFQPYSFYLGGKRTYLGLPNNPNYEMGPDTGSVCDSLPHLGVGINNSENNISSVKLNIFYHSGWQIAFINAEGLKGKNYSLTIFDLMGREAFKEEGKLSSEYFTKDLSCSSFANGMYIVNLQTEKEVMSKKFVKE